ncbi:hypothetical protein Clacol_002675 [Clathrus columnatus]|uniref:Asteroid domain-containing protein n=1 Tax=Clathrus columnatus TaxID=1419009 RepID=A0AAV5A4S2_9AGAM|nr:hypothetical protein Clacol_002675 [Clathrus columnatus]
MGVKGLTTYLKENRHKLSQVREFQSVNGIPSESVNVVVDGWSLLYAIYIQSGEPWVYGGEYTALSRYAENVVSAWKLIGFCPTIVFDGPAPPIKYRTLIARLQDSCVKPSNLFFRTSQAARTTPRSLAENRIAPPLGYTTIVSTLMAMDGVDVKFAEGEADPYIVTLAGKLQAYVIGKDSDFVVFNSEGYRGYIPLDELVWSIPAENGGFQINADTIPNDHDHDFQPVVKKKQRRQSPNDGVLPPTHQSNLVLLVSIYEPTLLAIHVDLPVPLLPLLGAIIGNDYASLDFFRSSESVVERVQRVASTLSLVLKEAQSNNAKKTRQILHTSNGGAMDVIGTTIERLLLWRDPKNPPTADEIDGFTETIVQSTLEYAVGSSASLFPDSDANGFQPGTLDCSSLNLKERVQTLYQQAYHLGVMHFRLMETFCRGVCFPGLFLEDPDKESVARSIGGPIRRSIWQLFVCGGGIPETDSSEDKDSDESEDKDAANPDDDDDDDDDELIDVIEEDTDDAQSFTEAEEDPLAVLRGRIQRMSFSESEGGLLEFDRSITSEVLEEVEEEDEEGEDESIQLPRQPKSVTEFLRKGSRIVPEVNPVVDILDTFWYDSADKIPVQLRSLSERINIFLRLLGSDTHRIREMISGRDPSDRDMRKYVLWILSYRWILQTLHSRCEEIDDNANRKRLREQEKWTRAESEAILSSLSSGQQEDNTNEAPLPPVTDRAVQLTAQLLTAFGTIQWLAQALLLMAPPGEQLLQQGPPLILGEAEKLFSGRIVHTNLTQQQPPELSELSKRLWTAASEGVENTLAEPKGKGGKKVKKNDNRASPKVEPRRTFITSSSRFSVLADLDT